MATVNDKIKKILAMIDGATTEGEARAASLALQRLLVANDMTLDEIASEMAAGEYDVCSRETLLSYAISEIENDRLFLARHILDAVDSGEYADFYFYDITMGTLDTPLAIESIGDLVDHIAE